MGFFYLFAAIFAETAGKTLDKLNFRRTNISPQLMTWLTFLIMSSVLFGWVWLTHQPVPEFSLTVIGLIVIIGLFSFGGNVFDVLSLKRTDLSLREPLVGFEPISAGLLGYLLFPDQRKPIYLVAFILGVFVVRWGISRRKLRISQKKGLAYLWISVMLYAILPSIYQFALEYITPSWLALFRCSIVFVFVTLFFAPKNIAKQLTVKRFNYTFVASIFYAIGAVVSMYAISAYGVALTMLFLMLAPALKYLSAYFILRENVRKGELLSSLMLAVIVAVAAFA
jgi:drug/metabolite transporter (DMT)-like permease